MTAAAHDQARLRKELAEIGGAAPHEARHVAAAMLVGVPVVDATAIPQLEDGEVKNLGRVDLDPGRREYGDVRARALVLLAGGMGEKGWPPPHPADPAMRGKVPADPDNDGAQVWKAIEALGLDELGYEVLVQEAHDLVARRDFKRLEIGVAHLLEQGHVVGPELLDAVKKITQQETKTVAVSARAIDGDRFAVLGDVRGFKNTETDRVAKGAFDQTSKRWQESGEQIPLYWSEITNFRDRIGSVDPASIRDEGIVGAGL